MVPPIGRTTDRAEYLGTPLQDHQSKAPPPLHLPGIVLAFGIIAFDQKRGYENVRVTIAMALIMIFSWPPAMRLLTVEVQYRAKSEKRDVREKKKKSCGLSYLFSLAYHSWLGLYPREDVRAITFYLVHPPRNVNRVDLCNFR